MTQSQVHYIQRDNRRTAGLAVTRATTQVSGIVRTSDRHGAALQTTPTAGSPGRSAALNAPDVGPARSGRNAARPWPASAPLPPAARPRPPAGPRPPAWAGRWEAKRPTRHASPRQSQTEPDGAMWAFSAMRPATIRPPITTKYFRTSITSPWARKDRRTPLVAAAAGLVHSAPAVAWVRAVACEGELAAGEWFRTTVSCCSHTRSAD